MLRHAQMPKGSRRAPTSTDGFILGLRHTAQWVGLFVLSLFVLSLFVLNV
jgi:hypothetical protein